MRYRKCRHSFQKSCVDIIAEIYDDEGKKYCHICGLEIDYDRKMELDNLA